MTVEEFSNEFDILYNNITSNQAPGLDEYEKSVFLTKAQDQIVKAYFNPKLNKTQEGFDASERRQIDFSMLIRVETFSQSDKLEAAKLDTKSNSKAVNLKGLDILFILSEFIKTTANKILVVEPLAYKEYSKLMMKPYKRPLKNQAWRLLNSAADSQSNIGLYSDLIVGFGEDIASYTIRYVKRPEPIILQDLEDGLTIGGVGAEKNGDDAGKVLKRECELDPILHQEILQRAVELAKAAYAGDISSMVALGQNSQTEMGIVAPSK